MDIALLLYNSLTGAIQPRWYIAKKCYIAVTQGSRWQHHDENALLFYAAPLLMIIGCSLFSNVHIYSGNSWAQVLVSFWWNRDLKPWGRESDGGRTCMWHSAWPSVVTACQQTSCVWWSTRFPTGAARRPEEAGSALTLSCAWWMHNTAWYWRLGGLLFPYLRLSRKVLQVTDWAASLSQSASHGLCNSKWVPKW